MMSDSNIGLFFDRYVGVSMDRFKEELILDPQLYCILENTLINLSDITFSKFYIKFDTKRDLFISHLAHKDNLKLCVWGQAQTLEESVIDLLSKVDQWRKCIHCDFIYYEESNHGCCAECYELQNMPSDEKFDCIVCTLTKPNNERQILYCGHNEMCRSCWFKMKGFKCPICRRDIIKVIDVGPVS